MLSVVNGFGSVQLGEVCLEGGVNQMPLRLRHRLLVKLVDLGRLFVAPFHQMRDRKLPLEFVVRVELPVSVGLTFECVSARLSANVRSNPLTRTERTQRPVDQGSKS